MNWAAARGGRERRPRKLGDDTINEIAGGLSRGKPDRREHGGLTVNHATRRGPTGFLVVGAMKLASGLALGAAAFGVFRLMHGDVGAAVERFVGRLHLDPENRLVHAVIGRVAGVTPKQLGLIGVGTMVYALLHLVEGTGLLLRRPWAAYLTVVVTGSLLPVELYEMVHRPTAVRVGVLAVNLAVVAYLAVKLRQERRESRGVGHAAGPTSPGTPGGRTPPG